MVVFVKVVIPEKVEFAWLIRLPLIVVTPLITELLRVTPVYAAPGPLRFTQLS